MKNIETLREMLENRPARSAWDKGVKVYAFELLDTLENANESAFENRKTLKAAMLNGARDWNEYSYGGCAEVYDGDIAERLCTPSELRRKRGGELSPNSRETWLDVQARALSQAARIVSLLVF